MCRQPFFVTKTAKRALALGKFNALHLGHLALLRAALPLAEPALLRFGGMAAALGWQERAPVVADHDRPRVLRMWSAWLGQRVSEIVLPFAPLRGLSPEEFLDFLCAEQAPSAIVVGTDFRFGRDRCGDVETIRRYTAARGMALAVVEAERCEGEVISTTRVRAALEAGDVALVARLLGRPHRLCGRVVHGDGRGRRLGYPTANCGHLASMPPRTGVYAAWAHLPDEGPIAAAVNVGHLPTLGPDRPLVVEAHLLDWDGDCYDQSLALDLVERVRPETRFASLPALIDAIAADCRRVRRWLIEGELLL